MRKILLASIVVLSVLACDKASKSEAVPVDNGAISYFQLDQVKLLKSPFKNAEELDIKYLLELEPDRLLAPFLREAGLEPKAESYPNWENTGLDGHIGGHYVSALSLMYASTGNSTIKERLDYMLAELKRCQDANGNGYIGGVPGGSAMWKEIKEGNIRAGGFSLNDKWVPLYNIHKTYSGLRDAYLYTGSQEAKEMLIKFTDWMIAIVSDLSDEQIQELLISEHGGLNEVFADVAAITGSDKYLKLAKQFSHKEILDPLLNHEDKLTGMHANTQIPKVIGFERIAEIDGDTAWSNAANYFWDDVVNKRSVVIGGNSAYEHFHPTNDFTKMIMGTQGPETCNTYNMLKLTKMLYQDHGTENYMEYYEQALYNHILSTQDPETGGLVYFTQMRPGHYRVYSQPQTSFWCCVGSGIENHAKYGEMIYAHTDKSLIVNLFIPSSLQWKDKGVTLIQENSFPQEAATYFTVNTDSVSEFTLRLRNPKWTQGKASVTVNGETLEDLDTTQGYIAIHRKWNNGDKITFDLPMNLKAVQMPDDSNYFAYMYGPIVLAAKTGTDHLDGLFADASRGGHIAHGEIVPLNEIPTIVSKPNELTSKVSKVKDEPLHFKLGSLFPEEKYTDSLELIPFYQLHEARYMIYFPQATQEGLKEMQEKLEAQEAAERILEEKSEDVVLSGEQQPESDHFIKQDGTWTGYDYEQHFREGSGWFSYQMKNTAKKGKYVYVQYLDVDKLRACDIFINGKKLEHITSNGDDGKTLKTITVEIPDSLKDSKEFTVKITAANNLWMPKIVQVRVLNTRL
ncbi:hypothetical protein SAMN05216480_1175 [Pustulibacterium marinum]|uniref:Uncharacterized protein n=1 Tax=Pustulibacterium marinum TaxID=1224947 RepID=A0A1I7IJE7_9FLAO|nr:glycoside hydrolase family 127 protein [Pustulibacterium marinum]SFU73042.1 hypothetical protein SAMN05216480_1175 [Pustulibacterium marinum]